MSLGAHRYQSNAAALAMPRGARVAEELLAVGMRKRLHAPEAWAYVAAMAKDGDPAASELLTLIHGGAA
jgi:hypothetical protein